AAKTAASEKVETDYSVASWKVLTDALAMAEDKQSEIDSKTAAINSALEGLTVDTTALEAAKALAAEKVETDYSEVSWKALTDALDMPETKQSEIDRKASAINSAISDLTTDTTALEAAKALAAERVETDYSVASWNVLKNALAMAEDKQSEIDAKVAAINSAIAGLTTDTRALEAAKTAASEKVETDYSVASWKVLTDALAMAENKQSEIDRKVSAINSAIAGLTTDTTALEAAKAVAAEKVEADYSVASWKALTDALAMTEEKQSEIDAKVEAINSAIAGLTTDTRALEAVKAEAESKVEADYSVASWKALTDALAMAEEKQSEINAKVEAISNAISGLTVDTTALETAKAVAAERVEADYSVESWKVLTDALAMTEGKQSEIDAKTAAINSALAGLTVDTTALEAVKAEAESKVEADYSVASWKALTDALAMTEGKQSEIDAKVAAINSALAGLTTDTTALEAAKVEAAGKVEADYSVESWGEFQEALEAALAMKEEKQSEINSKVEAINDAIAKLRALQPEFTVILDPETIVINGTANVQVSAEGIGQVSYESDNTEVATVENGIVTGHKEGTAVITVKYAGDDTHAEVYAQATITVEKIPSKFPTLTTINMTYSATAIVGNINLPTMDSYGQTLEGTLAFADTVDQTAKIGDVGTKTYDVVYTPNDTNYAPVTDKITVEVGKANQVAINTTSIPDKVNKEETTNFEITIANAENLKGTPTFTSSNENVLTIDNEGNVTVIGVGKTTITIEYPGDNNYNSVSATKEVIVVAGTKPVIMLTGKPNMEVELGTEYNDEGATASNNLGEDITGNIQTAIKFIAKGTEEVQDVDTVDTTKLGTYTITYNVTDSEGVAAEEVTRTVKVVDKQKPIIGLKGESTVEVEVGDTYTDAGATAIDNYDGDITERVKTTIEFVAKGTETAVEVNTVDTTKLGTYTIKYNVTDSSDNTADEVTRTVKVVDTQKPVIELETTYQRLEAQIGGNYPKVAGKATDTVDGDVELTVEFPEDFDMGTVGVYDVVYNAEDSSGNKADPVVVTVQIIDTTAPTIAFKNAADATQVYTRGGTYKTPEFNVSDNANGEIVIVDSGIVDSSTPGKYTVEYYAVDKSGNRSKETLVVEVTVQNYAPVICYVRNGAINPIIEGEDYDFNLKVEFDETATAVLTNKTTGVQTPIYNNSDAITDGIYSLTVTLPDGATTTVNFEVNTKGPKTNLVDKKTYVGEQTIIVDRPETLTRATLIGNDGNVIEGVNKDNINNYTTQSTKTGLNKYVLILVDNKDRRTEITFTVYIKP
ncbi:MAG: DUF5011 domain-containing protein, partial [Clostridia bacterium]|nr:DUF5011 domain-containing protein [Clostridia bacterium]